MENIDINRIQRALLGRSSPEEVEEIISILNNIKASNSYTTADKIIASLADPQVQISGNANILGNNNYLVYIDQSGAKAVAETLDELWQWRSKRDVAKSGELLSDKLLAYTVNISQNPEFSNWGQEHYFSLQIAPNQTLSNIDLLLVIRETGDVSNAGLKYTFTTEDAIAKFKQLVIIGQPGSGKTTTLRNLTLVFAQKFQVELNLDSNDFCLPVFIRLPNFNSVTGVTPYDRFLAMVKYAFQELHLDLTEQEFKETLQKRKIIFLLDGLNEIGNPESTSGFVDGLNTFVSNFPQHNVVITSRSYNFRLSKIHLPVLELLELKYPNEVNEYLARYFVNRDEIKKIMDVFDSNPRLRQLSTNPLLLFLIIVIFKNQQGVLPANRSLLLEKIAYGLMGEWSLSVRQTDRFWIEDKNKLLQLLGYKMKFEGLEISRPRIIEIMKSFLQSDLIQFSSENNRRPPNYEVVTIDNIGFLLDELKRDRVLFEVGNSDKIRFWHQTLQEYFAAVFVLRKIVNFNNNLSTANLNDQNLKRLIEDESWHEILSLAYGLIISSEYINIPLRKKIFHQLIAFTWKRNKVLASLSLTNADDDAIVQPYVEQLKKTIFLFGISVPRLIPWIMSALLIVVVWLLPEPRVNISLSLALASLFSIFIGAFISLIFFRLYVSVIDFYEVYAHQKYIRPSIIALGYMKNKPAEKVLAEFNDQTVHDFSVSDHVKVAMRASESLIRLSEDELLALLEEQDDRSIQIIEILGERGLRGTINSLSAFLPTHISELDNQIFNTAIRSLVHLIKLHNVSKNELSELANTLNAIVIDDRFDYSKRINVYRALVSMGFSDTKAPSVLKEIRIFIVRYILLALAIVLTIFAIALTR